MRHAPASRRDNKRTSGTAWTLYINSLILATAVSPRIPLNVPIPGRIFELRLEDVLLVLVIPLWLARRAFHTSLTPIVRPFAVYLMIAAVTTIIGVATVDLSPARATVYFGKELEYFVTFLIAAASMTSESALRSTIRALLFVGLINGVWVGYQAATGSYHPLLAAEVVLGPGESVDYVRFSAYGPYLLGEGSPLSTGGFFMVESLLAASWHLSATSAKPRLVSGMMACGFLTCVAVSQSRVSLFGAIAGILVILIAHGLTGRRMNVVPAGGMLLAILVTCLTVLPTGVDQRLAAGNVQFGIAIRETFWPGLLQNGLDRFFVGYGMGSIGSTPGLALGLGENEAHMQYLRVFVESGIYGLVAFLAVLVSTSIVGVRVVKQGGSPASRVLGSTALGAMCGMAVASVFQDAFVPVLLNELFWLVIGLASAAYMIERQRLTQYPRASTTRGAAVTFIEVDAVSK